MISTNVYYKDMGCPTRQQRVIQLSDEQIVNMSAIMAKFYISKSKEHA